VDRSGSGWRELVGICEHGTEPSGSIKCENFDKGIIWLLKNSAPWIWLG